MLAPHPPEDAAPAEGGDVVVALAGTARDARTEFERALSPLLPELRAVALRLTRAEADADDLVQEAALRAWRAWSRSAPQTNARAWLVRITKNAFVSRYRRRRREREILELYLHERETLAPPSSKDVADEALSDEVAAGIAALAPEYRKVLWTVAVDGCSYRETAEQLDCPIGTVMSRLYRARRAMQAELAAA
jgi:RNA polymerase sigma-70 factor (ECF subfamily)